MKIFSEAILSLWNKCEIRSLVLLSLLWQVILIMLGPMRKHQIFGIKGVILHSVVWVTYLSADWLATVALGNLATNQIAADKSNSKSESKEQVLQALWAPFLLLHLGGPDTITAYSLEDNTLWMRHLLGLIVQVSVAFYIFLRSWSSDNALAFVAIPVFVSGIIKYSERNWVLRSATPDQFEDSLHTSSLTFEAPNRYQIWNYNPELDCLHTGYSLFPVLKHLYANVPLSSANKMYLYSTVTRDPVPGEVKPAVYMFKVIQVQLGFLFDVLYTKASIIYTKTGLLSRLISVISMTAAFVAFIIIVNVINDAYYSSSRVDVVITYILFIGAAFLEFYAFVSIILSDWTVRWLTQSKRRGCLMKLLWSFISHFRSILRSNESSKIYMGQLSLLDLCLKERTMYRSIGDGLFNKISFKYNLLRNQRFEEVDTDWKERISEQLEKRIQIFRRELIDSDEDISREVYEITRLRELLCPKRIQEARIEFGSYVLGFHLVTDIYYYYHHHHLGNNNEAAKRELKASKKISDYFFYLLVQHPSLLPPCADRIRRIQDTFNHVIWLFNKGHSPVTANDSAHDALIKLIQSTADGKDNAPQQIGRSLLENALAHFHRSDQLGGEYTMNMIPGGDLTGMWIDLLIYAASQYEWGGSHALQLTGGGEFLTHLALLMTELGLSEHATPLDVGDRATISYSKLRVKTEE